MIEQSRGVRSAWRPDPFWIGMVLLGLFLRAVLLTSPGYGPDVSFWKSYLSYANTFGIEHVYGLETPLQPYPPVVLYLLWGLGSLYTSLWPQAGDSAALTAFVKLPAVVGDLVAAITLAGFARRHRTPGSLSHRWAAAILALHPALIWVSAYWGQVDVLHGGFTSAAWGLALAGCPATAGVFAALAVLTKPQGLIILPMLGVLIVSRSGVRALLRALLLGFSVVLLLCAPFLITGYARSLVGIYSGASNLYPYLSVNAFNPWWILSLVAGGGRDRALIPDSRPVVGPVTAAHIGMVLFLIATVWIAWRAGCLGRSRNRVHPRAWRLLTLQWLAFFLLPTQIHERYLVPAVIALAPAAVLERRSRTIYLALSIAVLLNVAYLLPGSDAVLWIVRILSGEGVLVAFALVAIFVRLLWMEIKGDQDAT